MNGVGDQRQAAGNDAAGNLGDGQADIDHHRPQHAPIIGRGVVVMVMPMAMRMAMLVSVVVIGLRQPQRLSCCSGKT